MTGPDRRKPRSSGAAAIVISAAALLCVYAVVTGLTGWMPRCPFKMVTGLDCPGCGSQRALMALLHGHPLEAWSYNLFLPFAVAYIVALLVVPRGTRLGRVLESPAALWILLALIVAWTILRNLI